VADGLFYFAVQHEGRTWHHYGRFVRIERPRHVEYTWVSEATKGVESVVACHVRAAWGPHRGHSAPLGCPRRRIGTPAPRRLDLGSIDAGGALRFRRAGSGVEIARRGCGLGCVLRRGKPGCGLPRSMDGPPCIREEPERRR
jgi:hypothetical protein